LLILEPVCRPEGGEADTAIAVAEAAVETSPAGAPAVPAPSTALTAAMPAPSPPPILQPRAKPGAGLWPPVTFDAPTAPRAPAPPATVVAARAPEPAPSAAAPERYLVLGTFRQRGNAESLAGRLLDAGAVITDPEPGIGQFHRVVIGPLAAAELPGLRQRVQARGVAGAWTATLCLNANAVEMPCGGPAAAPLATQTATIVPPRAVMPGAQIAARTLALSTDPIY
jgi:hypothetical protein